MSCYKNDDVVQSVRKIKMVKQIFEQAAVQDTPMTP